MLSTFIVHIFTQPTHRKTNAGDFEENLYFNFLCSKVMDHFIVIQALFFIDNYHFEKVCSGFRFKSNSVLDIFSSFFVKSFKLFRAPEL